MQTSILKNALRASYRFLTVQTLGARFFWIIVSTSLLSAVLYGLVVAKFWGQFVDGATQKVNYGLARELAELVKGTYGADSVREAQEVFSEIADLFPGFDLYLYSDSEKNLISSSRVRSIALDTGPLRAFLASDGKFERPITLPAKPFPHLQRWERYPFSTAPIELGGKEYYLIAILGGSRNVKARAASSGQHLSVFAYYLLASVMFTGCVLLLLVLAVLPSRLRRMSLILKEFEKGDYSRRIKDSSSDELGMYARSFDTMAETIERTMEDLTTQNNLRRTLVADVSHELRRPLTVLNLSLETLIEENARMSEKERKRHLDQALACGENLSRKISDLFELSRLEARTSLPQLHRVDGIELLTEVVRNLDALAKEKHVSVEIAVDTTPFLLNADEVLLEQALSNLLENAIKHSPRGAGIILSVKRQFGKAYISVQDAGAGIPEADLPRIFKRFFKGSTSNPEGGGLGLAIAKRIVELHGSTLVVNSSLGSGSTLSFCLDEC